MENQVKNDTVIKGLDEEFLRSYAAGVLANLMRVSDGKLRLDIMCNELRGFFLQGKNFQTQHLFSALGHGSRVNMETGRVR